MKRFLLLATIALAAAGCGSGTTSAKTANSPPPPPTSAGPQTASYTDNGKSITLSVGQELTVTLNSTYWQFGTPVPPSVVVPVGASTSQVCTNGPSFPGSGCGTVVQTFKAMGRGTAVLSASRRSCGEAMLCRPADSTWKLMVTVQ